MRLYRKSSFHETYGGGSTLTEQGRHFYTESLFRNNRRQMIFLESTGIDQISCVRNIRNSMHPIKNYTISDHATRINLSYQLAWDQFLMFGIRKYPTHKLVKIGLFCKRIHVTLAGALWDFVIWVPVSYVLKQIIAYLSNHTEERAQHKVSDQLRSS